MRGNLCQNPPRMASVRAARRAAKPDTRARALPILKAILRCQRGDCDAVRVRNPQPVGQWGDSVRGPRHQELISATDCAENPRT